MNYCISLLGLFFPFFTMCPHSLNYLRNNSLWPLFLKDPFSLHHLTSLFPSRACSLVALTCLLYMENQGSNPTTPIEYFLKKNDFIISTIVSRMTKCQNYGAFHRNSLVFNSTSISTNTLAKPNLLFDSVILLAYKGLPTPLATWPKQTGFQYSPSKTW